MFTKQLIMILIMLLFMAHAYADKNNTKTSEQTQNNPFSIYRFDMKSQAGLDYHIQVAIPSHAPPANGWSAILLTDGEAYFDAFSGMTRVWSSVIANAMQQPAHSNTKSFEPNTTPVIIAIGYPGKEVLNKTRRSFDFIPKPTALGDLEHEHLGGNAGGAEMFLSFLLNELLPAVATQNPIDLQRITLVGHSLGGYFSLYALSKQPEAFHAIVAISPSIWVNPPALISGVQHLMLTNKQLPQTVLLAVAKDELPPYPERSRIMLNDAREMYKHLEKLTEYGMQSKLLELEEENHMTTPFAILTDILRIAGAEVSAETTENK